MTMAKKTARQRVKPRFKSVMSRGAGGAIKEVEIGIAEAMTDFGQPIIEIMTKPFKHDKEKQTSVLKQAIDFTSLIWNSAIDNDCTSAIEALSSNSTYTKIFNIEQLVPAMIERFDEMFPSFRAPSERNKRTVRKSTEVSPFDITEYLSGSLKASVDEQIQDEVKFLNNKIFKDDAIDYAAEIEKSPHDSALRLEFAEELMLDEQYDDALEQFKAAYSIAVANNDHELISSCTHDALQCLHSSGHSLDDFPWKAMPKIMSAPECIAKLIAYLRDHNGTSDFFIAFDSVIGNSFIDPAANVMELIHESNDIGVIETEDKNLNLVLLNK